MTAYQIDMARVLGWPRPSPRGNDDLYRMHLQMLPAMQAFVEHARLEPDVF